MSMNHHLSWHFPVSSIVTAYRPMRQEPRSRLGRFSVFVFALMSLVVPSVAEDAPGLTIALPPQTELDKLIDLTARFVGVSIQYNPQKPRAAVPHAHGYGTDGRTKVRDPVDGNPHFPTR